MFKLIYQCLLLLLPGLLLLQQKQNGVCCQGFAEVGSVKLAGAGGAGSILPYSSASRAAGGRGDYVDPRILNANHGQSVSHGPMYVGAKLDPNVTFVNDAGPVFHFVFDSQTGVPGPSRTDGRQPSWTRPSLPGSVLSSIPSGGGPASDSGTSSAESGVLPSGSTSSRPVSGGRPGGGGGGGGGSYTRSVGGGGRLIDPPNRSSLWREGVRGAPVNLLDNQLNCGALHMPILSSDVDDMGCGVCGDSPIGPPDHVIGGRYVRLAPMLSRAYAAGGVIQVRFLLNHTIIPGMDRVTFYLCRIPQQRGVLEDVTWDCLNEGGALQITGGSGGGHTYLPSRPGLHRVYLRLPPFLTCRRCVLQWRWQSSQLTGKQVCARQPWIRSCYRPIEYINCADISIRPSASSPAASSSSPSSFAVSSLAQLMLVSGLNS